MIITRQLDLDLKREVLTESYYHFFLFAFKLLHPGQEFGDNFHVKYLCDILQSEAERMLRNEEKDKDILINIPPRTSKSLIFSVCLLPWMWIRQPELKFITISFDSQLALLNSQLSRDIIGSQEYQDLFGHCFFIRPDIDSKGYFSNNKGGYRLSRTTGQNVTGFSGHCLPYNELISTDKGDLKIGDIVTKNIDCQILSYNHESNTNEYKKINHRLTNQLNKRKLIKINTSEGSFTCTEDHKIWSETRKCYVKAIEVKNGEKLLYINNNNNKICELISFKIIELDDGYVYDLEIDDNHNFFVNNHLVHNCIVVDDPDSAMSVYSQNERDFVHKYYFEALYNRLTPANFGFRCIVQQRLHEMDLTGAVLERQKNAYHHICLPAELTNNVKPAELKQFYQDGLLDKKRLSIKLLSNYKQTLGTSTYTGQYLQTPTPSEGGIFKRDWFDIIKPESIYRDPNVDIIHFFLDTAYTEKTTNDPTAITTCFAKNNILYILDVTEVWLEFPQLLEYLKKHILKYQYNPQQSRIYVEPKASGKSVVQQLRSSTMLNVVELPTPKDSKVTRANSVAPICESKRVKLIEGNYTQGFIDQLIAFPHAAHDDMTDSFVYSVSKLLPVNNTPDFGFLSL